MGLWVCFPGMRHSQGYDWAGNKEHSVRRRAHAAGSVPAGLIVQRPNTSSSPSSSHPQHKNCDNQYNLAWEGFSNQIQRTEGGGTDTTTVFLI